MPYAPVTQRFIHMLPAERELWTRFLSKHGRAWGRWEYDVRVGEGIPLDPGWPENIARAAKMLTQKRIDALVRRGGVIHIFEVKPWAGLSAFGQLLAYRELYRRTYGWEGEIRLHLVTDQIDRDTRWLMEGQGIKVWVV